MAVNLSPIWGAGAQLLDNSGNVLSGGKIYTYAAGTTTQVATYTSNTGATANSNPIILNSAGRVPYEIWLTDGQNYKFVLKDSNDVLIGTWDNLSGINSNFIAYTNQQEIQTATAGQTVFNLTTMNYLPGTNSLSVFVDGVNQYGPGAQYAFEETDSNTVTFVSGLHVGAEVKFTSTQIQGAGAVDASQVSYTPPFTNSVATNVEDKLAQYVSVKDFGAVGDGVIDDTTAIQDAIDSGVTILDLCGSTYAIETNLTFDSSNQTIRNGTLLFNGDNTQRIGDVNGDNVTFENVVFDGNEKQPRSALIWVNDDVQHPVFCGCTFKKITGIYWGTSALNACYAVLISPLGVVNFEFTNCLFQDLIKYNDGANTSPVTPAAVGLGFIGGICFLPEDLNPSPTAQTVVTQGIVEGCTFDNIQTILAAGLSEANQIEYNDADAIRTYGDANTPSLYIHVSDCVFKQVSKRAVKFRASGSNLTNCEVFADGMQYGMISPVDVTCNNRIQSVKIYTSSGKPVYNGITWAPGPVYNKEVLLENIFVEYCVNGINFFSDASNQALENLFIRSCQFNQCSNAGVVQSAPLPTSMSNINIENTQIWGNGNNCQGIVILGVNNSSATISNKLYINDVYLNNASVYIGGFDNTLNDVTLTVDSNTFAAGSSSQALFRCGDTGGTGYQNVENLNINAYNLNTSFLNATRTNLVVLIGNNAVYKNLRVKVPDALTTTYPHASIYGNNWMLDGYSYYGYGFTFTGVSVASTKFIVRNAVRFGSSASTTEFLYSSNASNSDGVIENITDFNPTTAISVRMNQGTNYIITNVSSNTTNVNIAQAAGTKTITNANYLY